MFVSFHEVVLSEFEEAWLIPKLHVCFSLACKNTQFRKRFVNSVTACTVLFQPSMLPEISKQQLDFVFQKYIQINFKYLWEIKIAFLQNLYLQNYSNIWNYLVYWEGFGATVQLYSSGVCSVRTSQGCFVWAVCRTSLPQEPPQHQKGFAWSLFTGT